MADRLPPYRTFLASDSEIREILRAHRAVAMTGMAEAEESHDQHVARQLRQRGYRVIPVGCAATADLTTLGEPVEIVNVRSAPESVPHIVRQTVAAGAAVLWLEAGASNPEAAFLAARRGLKVILGRDILAEYEMHFPDDELGY